jgi:Uncharacterized protein conserved in bacteria
VTGPLVAIVADDLTGAGDTAVQFVRAGWVTQLSMGGADEALSGAGARAEVLAVTTNSRAMAPAAAGEAVRREVRRLRQAGVRRLYKKVDSTLRGAFRAEIEAARAAWSDDAVAVICPAFPATGRTVRDGVLLVDDRPVTETSAATDPVTPVTQSHIPTLLGCAGIAASPDETPQALAARIAQAGPVVVVDAASEEDLERLARAVAELGERALPVGAGGLAGPLARIWAGAQARGPVVVVVTSQHSAARSQAQTLQERGARTWAPAPQQLADPAAWESWAAGVVASERGVADAGRDDTVLLLAPEGRHAGLDADTVAARLGELAARLIDALGAAGVVATGGDGARQVLQSLGATGIALVDEVTGGVPMGTLTGGRAAGLPVVTKAGGFGSADVLVRAAQAIRERRFAT